MREHALRNPLAQLDGDRHVRSSARTKIAWEIARVQSASVCGWSSVSVFFAAYDEHRTVDIGDMIEGGRNCKAETRSRHWN